MFRDIAFYFQRSNIDLFTCEARVFFTFLQGQSRLQYSGINNALEIKRNGKQKIYSAGCKKCKMSKGYGKILPVNTISNTIL